MLRKTNMTTIILPSLHLSEDFQAVRDSFPEMNTPCLSRLCAYAKVKHTSHNTTHLMSNTFSGSLKALALRDLDLPLSTPACFLSPVMQHADMHSVQVMSGADLSLSWTQAHRIVNVINDFIQEDGLIAHVYRPDLWLMTGELPTCWNAPDIWSLNGRVNGNDKITGEDASAISKLLTELQMLLHLPSTENQAVNSIWLWQDIQGLADASTVSAGAISWLPDDKIISIEDFSWKSIKNTHATVIYCDTLQKAIQNQNMAQWLEKLHLLEAELFQPLLEDFLSGSLKVCLMSEQRTLNLSFWHRFWQRRKWTYQGFLP